MGVPGERGPAGRPGEPGESVAGEILNVGDPNCPNGGIKLTLGTVVAYACSGEDGAPGPNGIDGTHCWDTNQDQVCDFATEDINGDSTCDALDCVGPMGPEGPEGPPGAGMYCGATSTTTTGNIGGYAAAKALCEAACANSTAHMCTAHEMAMSWQSGIVVPSLLWYSAGGRSTPSNLDATDCIGWTSDSSTTLGPRTGGAVATGHGVTLSCDVALAVACCL